MHKPPEMKPLSVKPAAVPCSVLLSTADHTCAPTQPDASAEAESELTLTESNTTQTEALLVSFHQNKGTNVDRRCL